MEKHKNIFMDELRESMMDFLNEKGYKTFLGGSRRFGYHQEDSDIDIMILARRGHETGKLVMELRKLGFHKNHTHYTDAMSSVFTLGNLYHICIMNDENAFFSLEAEHNMIDKALKNQVVLFTFIKNFRKKVPELSGSILYKIIRDTVT